MTRLALRRIEAEAEDAAAILAALDGWTLVRTDDLRRWNATHGNTCPATTLGPDSRCTCGLSAALSGGSE